MMQVSLYELLEANFLGMSVLMVATVGDVRPTPNITTVLLAHPDWTCLHARCELAPRETTGLIG